MLFYIAQGVGFIGTAFLFFSFQHNSKKKILWLQAGTAAAFALHFFMLGAFAGMAVNLLNIPRNIIFTRKQQRRWTYIFIGLYLLLGFLIWEGPVSLLPIIAACISTVVFSLKNPRHIRFFSVPIVAFWLIYNIFSFSIPGVLTEVFGFISITIAIVRYDICKKNDKDDA